MRTPPALPPHHPAATSGADPWAWAERPELERGLLQRVADRLRQHRRLGMALLAALLLAGAGWAVWRYTSLGPLRLAADGTPMTQGRKAGEEMTIPEGALERGDLSFFEGYWQVGDERMQIFRGEPPAVIGTYRLVIGVKPKGDGQVWGLEREYLDDKAGDCAGELTARAIGPKLYFETSRCADRSNSGRNLRGYRHECVRLVDGRARCMTIFADGRTSDITLRRLR